MTPMDRRAVLALLVSGLAALPRLAAAQPAARGHRQGIPAPPAVPPASEQSTATI
jgi:hypothetical protein